MFDQLTIGMKARYKKRVESAEIDNFARLSGDNNEIHTNQDFARQLGYRDRVVHGAFLVALASRLIGMELPGPKRLLLSLKLDFAAPTFPNDILEVMGQVESVHADQQVVAIRIRITCGSETRARGSALVRMLL